MPIGGMTARLPEWLRERTVCDERNGLTAPAGFQPGLAQRETKLRGSRFLDGALVDLAIANGVEALDVEMNVAQRLEHRTAGLDAIAFDGIPELFGVDDSAPLILRDEDLAALFALDDDNDPVVGHPRIVCAESGISFRAAVMPTMRAADSFDERLGQTF